MLDKKETTKKSFISNYFIYKKVLPIRYYKYIYKSITPRFKRSRKQNLF